MRLKNILYTQFLPWRFNLKKAEGSYLWSEDGKKLIDFTSGWNVCNLGWNHPEIAEAVWRQAKKNLYSPMWAEDPVQAEYAQKLISVLPRGLDRIGRVTGGAEAIEQAIKLARASTGRKRILGFFESYHGASINAMRIGYHPQWIKGLTDSGDDFLSLAFPQSKGEESESEVLSNLELNLERELSKEDVAAVVTECGIVTGWGEVKVAPKGFISLIRKLTQKYHTLLILDEVGTGFSRLGKLFGMEIEGIIPDIVTLAKGISNGAAPIGAAITKKEIADKGMEANLQSTFGWHPLGCAAGLKTLEIHQREKTWEVALANGAYIVKILEKELASRLAVTRISGIGMEIGIGLGQRKDARIAHKVALRAFENGLHIVNDGFSHLQIMPPLNINKKDLEKGLEILIDCLKTV